MAKMIFTQKYIKKIARNDFAGDFQAIYYQTTLQIILKVLGNLIVEMHRITTKDIMLGCGIGEIIDRDSESYTLLNETQRVLPQAGAVDSALTDKQLTLQMLRHIDK